MQSNSNPSVVSRDQPQHIVIGEEIVTTYEGLPSGQASCPAPGLASTGAGWHALGQGAKFIVSLTLL